MYVQSTSIKVPLDRLERLREVIATKYLAIARNQPGFMAGFLMEQTDDPNAAQLMLFWESHACVEKFNATGLLQASLYSLVADVPGIQVHREGYIVKVSTTVPKVPA